MICRWQRPVANHGLPFIKMGARDIRYGPWRSTCPQQAVGLSPAALIDPCLLTCVEKASTAGKLADGKKFRKEGGLQPFSAIGKKKGVISRSSLRECLSCTFVTLASIY